MWQNILQKPHVFFCKIWRFSFSGQTVLSRKNHSSKTSTFSRTQWPRHNLEKCGSVERGQNVHSSEITKADSCVRQWRQKLPKKGGQKLWNSSLVKFESADTKSGSGSDRLSKSRELKRLIRGRREGSKKIFFHWTKRLPPRCASRVWGQTCWRSGMRTRLILWTHW